MEQILISSNRARELIDQILTFSRQTDQEKKPIKIQPVIKEALKLLRASIPTTIEIRQKIADCCPMSADAVQLHQVIMNLCTNAFHAMMDQGGVLEVCLEEIELDQDDAAHYTDLDEGKYLKLTVSDTGHGMAPEIRERIFDPYFTTKEKGKGTGLGLSVVHGIINSHHGHISVYSEPDKGTSFVIYLPVIEEKTMVVKPEVFEEIPRGDESIMIVDDELQIVNMLVQMLSGLGYEVTSRTSSLEALEAFRYNPDRFDLIITDATMPNMTGVQLAREIQKIRANIPIILCSGYSDILSREKAQDSGIRKFIMKPVIKRELAQAIRNLLDRPKRHETQT
jgi:CheY-like chemotaxis protein